MVAALDDLEVVADARRLVRAASAPAPSSSSHPSPPTTSTPSPPVACKPASGQLLRARHDRRLVRRPRCQRQRVGRRSRFNVTVVAAAAVHGRRRPGLRPGPRPRRASPRATAARSTGSAAARVTAAVDDHETRVNLRRTDDVAGVDHLDGRPAGAVPAVRRRHAPPPDVERLRVQLVGAPRRLAQAARDRRPRRAERRDREVLGRRATSRSCATSTCRRTTTLRVVRVDGLVIPHLRSDAGRMLIDVGSGS